MKRRPWILILLAGFHIIAPLGNLALNAYWAKMPVLEYISIFLQPENILRQWPHIVIPVIAGIAIYACKKWSFWVYLFCMCFLLGASYVGYQERAQQITLLPLALAYTLNILIVAYFLIPAVRKIYFDPRLRWWETLPRYSCDIPAQFQDREQIFNGEIKNFSEGGVFLKSPHSLLDNALVTISFPYKEDTYQFQGHIIHHGQQRASGYGVKFFFDQANGKTQKKKAHQLAQVLADEGRLMMSRLPTEEDSFMFWLKKVIKTGKGILPDSSKK